MRLKKKTEREREITLSTRPGEVVLSPRSFNSTNQSSGTLKGGVATICNSLLLLTNSAGLSICSGVTDDGDDLPFICFLGGCAVTLDGGDCFRFRLCKTTKV